MTYNKICQCFVYALNKALSTEWFLLTTCHRNNRQKLKRRLNLWPLFVSSFISWLTLYPLINYSQCSIRCKVKCVTICFNCTILIWSLATEDCLHVVCCTCTVSATEHKDSCPFWNRYTSCQSSAREGNGLWKLLYRCLNFA